MRAGAASAEELRRLIALLEAQGVAERRPETRALLERSRRLLAVLPEARPQPSVRAAAGKLLALGKGSLDAAAVLAFLAAIALGTSSLGPEAALACLVLPPAWAALRLNRSLDAWHEGALALRYHALWGWDWWAEAFSAAAARRVEARLAARAIMRGWERHRAGLWRTPTLADVRDWLTLSYGAPAGQEFASRARAILGRRRMVRAWTLRGGGKERRSTRDKAARLQRLRWSALIEEFSALAASGTLFPAPRSTPPAAPPPPPVPPAEVESPERARRREELLGLIRRKRQDIQTSHGWKLKTEAEQSHRDAYQAGLRTEIAQHERELEALGVRR